MDQCIRTGGYHRRFYITRSSRITPPSPCAIPQTYERVSSNNGGHILEGHINVQSRFYPGISPSEQPRIAFDEPSSAKISSPSDPNGSDDVENNDIGKHAGGWTLAALG